MVRGVHQAALLLHDGVSMFEPWGNYTSFNRSQPIETLKRMKTLAGAVKESMRLYPIALTVPRVAAEPFAFEGCRVENAVGTYLHGPLLPRNPWLADWLLERALEHATGEPPSRLSALSDELEAAAFQVAAGRARTRGGRS